MQMQPQYPQPAPSLKELDFGFYISHFFNLFWRWKWYILISAPLMMVGWFGYLIKFGSVKPVLDASVVIGIDDSRTIGAVQEVGESVQGKIELIRARSFLKNVVEQLSLQLTITDLPRNAVFDSVKLDSTAIVGDYKFKLDKTGEGYIFTFSSANNKNQIKIKNQIIDNGKLSNIQFLHLPGATFYFSNSFLKNPIDLEFSIIPIRFAVERLRDNILIKGANSGSSSNRGGGTSATVTIKGRDYALIAATANLIASDFVERTTNLKKTKTREVINVLKKQLETATQQLEAAQNAVQAFRQQHPNVGLTTDLNNSVTNISQIESTIYVNGQYINDISNIKEKLISQQDVSGEMTLLINEAISFLTARNIFAAAPLQAEFNQQLQRQNELRNGFDKNHPFVADNKAKIGIIKNRVIALIDEYITTVNADKSKHQNQIKGINDQIRGLPALQLRLAELERQTQVNEQIHSTVMARYNQAKIADATEIADVFVMDQALEPIPPPDFINVLILMGIGIMLGLGVAFVPPIFFDLFDKTVRTETELKKILSFTILESLPVIEIKTKNKKNEPSNSKTTTQTRSIDTKLITSQFSPDFTNEIFRSLRAKIMLRFHDVPKKFIMISSFYMNEGKSLISANIAITMAQQNLRTILIDGDIRRGVQHNSFAVKKNPGLSSFLFSEETVTLENIQSLIQSTHVPNLSLISSGPNVPNPSELLGSPRLQKLIANLSTIFDVILFDTPPIGLAPDAAIISDQFSGCILVIKAGSTNTFELKKKLEEFPNLKTKVFGLVLNQSIIDSKMRKYKYTSYYYRGENS